MNRKAASAIRLALALSVTEEIYYRQGPVAYVKAQFASHGWIRDYVPRKYRKVAYETLKRQRERFKENN